MLKKCFRADLRANFRIFLPFLIGMGGAGLLVVALQFLLPWLSSLEASAPEDVAYALGTLGTLGFVLLLNLIFALFVCMVVLYILLVLQYRNSLYSDEGYLTMVLPVKGGTLFLSKYLAGLCCFAAGVVLALLPISTSLATSGEDYLFVVLTILSISGQPLLELMNTGNPVAIVTGVLGALIVIAVSFLLGCFAMSLGAVYQPRRRGRGAFLGVLTVLGVNQVSSAVLSMFSSVMQYIFPGEDAFSSSLPALLFSSWAQILLDIGLGVAAFFLIRHFLTKRVNLE